ncbi:MAG: sulfatase-like hydrolase/transferase, partial [Planctomycetes bacterium]|nr:sulfatase-like hydrolase/transferase [Planctomycetota bacterium]
MTRPNILWICTDQQRYDTIHGLNNPHINTPNLDRLMGEGVTFTHAFSQSPVCTPSRAAFLTGRYPRTCLGRQNGQAVFPDHEFLVTRILADAGYDCGLSGKLHLAVCDPRIVGFEPRTHDGYREFHWSHHPKPDWEGSAYGQWLKAQGKTWEELYQFPKGKLSGPGIPAEYHQTKWCADRAIDFMKENRDGPWLMSVNPFDPHHPFDPPEEYLRRYDPDKAPLPKYREGELDNKPTFQKTDHEGAYGGRGMSCAKATEQELREIVAAYYAMIEYLDTSVGWMLDALEETGQRENTIVVFHSDHGEMLGDHGILLKGPYFYDCAIRVPLIISRPGHFKEGLLSDALVELVDIPPMLMEACGMEPMNRMQGKSLLPLLTGEADPHEHKEAVYCEYYNAMIGHDRSAWGTMYRDRTHKICVGHGPARGEGELYDLEADPGEFENLWDSP